MIVMVIFVGFIFGLLYLMAYSFVFVLVIGLPPDHPLHWFAYFFCVLLGIYTAAQLMLPNQSTKPDLSETNPDSDSGKTRSDDTPGD